MILDPQRLASPSCFDGGEEGRYDEWRLQLVAHDPRFGEVAYDVTRRTTPYLLTGLLPDEEGKNACLMLHSVIIVGCNMNRPLRLIMDVQRQADGTAETNHAPASEHCWFRCRVH